MRPDPTPIFPVRFLILVFLLSIPFWLFGAFVSSEILPGLPVSSLMVVCPATVAGFLIWQVGGFPALRSYLKNAVDLEMSAWVWLFAIGVMPLVTAASGALLVLKGVTLPAPEISLVQFLALFSLFLIAALAEELGWTAYLTGPLVRNYGLLPAGLIVGAVAVIWHVIPLLQAEREFSWIAWWAIGTMCRRILIVWLYVKGGEKVLAATLFHTMNNVSWMMFPVLGSHYDPASVAIVLLLSVALIGFTSRNTATIETQHSSTGK